MEHRSKKKKHSLVSAENNNRVQISTSLVKKLFNKGTERPHCAKKLYHSHIAKTHPLPVSIYQLRGIFFEQQAIGSSSSHVGEDLSFRPLFQKRDEDKPMAETERILQQANFFKYTIAKEYDLNLDDVQVEGTKELDDDILLTGEADIISPIRYVDDDLKEHSIEMAVIDLKTTGDIYSTFREFAWSRPREMDHTQAYIYNMIFEMPFFYFVFDYSLKMNFKPIEKKIDEIELMEVMESIRKTKELILKYEKEGYQANPNYFECKNCPISELCDKFMSKQQIIKV